GTDFNENEAKKKTLACPICYDPLMWNGDPVFSVDSTPRSILKCGICKKVYSGNENHLDLTVTSGSKKYGEYRPASSEIFRLPLVSFLYERGWRQAFTIWGGFPGPEREVIYDIMTLIFCNFNRLTYKWVDLGYGLSLLGQMAKSSISLKGNGLKSPKLF
nr:uncharacterized methyltransferase At1g78140, chloroplastic-like [Tanacetum cinerariifolium]